MDNSIQKKENLIVRLVKAPFRLLRDYTVIRWQYSGFGDRVRLILFLSMVICVPLLTIGNYMVKNFHIQNEFLHTITNILGFIIFVDSLYYFWVFMQACLNRFNNAKFEVPSSEEYYKMALQDEATKKSRQIMERSRNRWGS